jgi:hypothetical protein
VPVVNMAFAEQLLPLIPRFKAGGIQASLWTLNQRAPLERALSLEVLNITTRETKLAVEVRGALQRQGSS